MQTARRYALCSLLGLGAALGQGIGVQPPTLGIVYNPVTRAVQRIDGIPGSAAFGAVLLAGVDSASLAPGGVAALAGRGARKYLVSGLGDAEPRWTPVPDHSTSAAFTPDGLQAVVAAGDAVLIFRQVDGSFQLQRSFATGLDGAISAAAMDPDGSAALLVSAAGNAGGVYLISLDTGLVDSVLTAAGRLAYSQARGGSLFVLQPDAARVYRLHFSPRGLQIADFPVSDRPGSNLTGIFCSSDGRQVAVVDSGARTVLLYGGAGDLQGSLELEVAPGRAEAAGDRFSVLMAGALGQPFFLLDFLEPRVFFVPAAATNQ